MEKSEKILIMSEDKIKRQKFIQDKIKIYDQVDSSSENFELKKAVNIYMNTVISRNFTQKLQNIQDYA